MIKVTIGESKTQKTKPFPISMKKVSFENQFGNKSEHGTWYLSNKSKAEKLYKELTK